MKNILLFIACIFVVSAYAQNCDIVSTSITNGVRTNNSNSAGGLDGYDSNNIVTEVASFAKSLCLGGNDPSGLLRLAANTYISQNDTDFQAGAIDINTGLEIIDYCSESRKMWKFTDDDIRLLQTKFAQGNLFVTDLTPDLTSYPAKNNVWYEIVMGYKLEQDLAPFKDFNNDGKYNPLDGDYPIVLEENPDFLPKAFSFTVYSDMEVHTSSQGAQIGVEVHQTNYLCYEDGVDLLNNTVYSRLKLINRSSQDIADFKVGFFISDDLGESYEDHAMGCDSTLNVLYAYNKYNGIDQDDGTTGVKLHLWLNRELESSMPLVREVLGDEIMWPRSAYHFYNFLNGKWRDGTPLTYGGIGLDSTSNDVTKFAFPDPPSDPNGWSMYTAQLAPNFFSVQSITSFNEGLFQSGDTRIIDLADVNLIDPNTTGFEKIDDLANIVAQVRDKYEIASTSSTSTPIKNTKELLLSPNPATTFISHSLPQNQSYIFDIFDMSGRQIDRQTLDGGNADISLHKLSRGIFVIKTRDKQGNVFVGKCVKI